MVHKLRIRRVRSGWALVIEQPGRVAGALGALA